MDNEEKILAMLQEIRTDQLKTMEIQRRWIKKYKIISRILLPVIVGAIGLMIWSLFSSQK
jgi:hypothetical protein